jgi:hypothetical protein
LPHAWYRQVNVITHSKGGLTTRAMPHFALVAQKEA